MVGTVTISLADFEALRKQAESGNKVTDEIVKAAKELEVFLSFLITRENIDDHVEEFNSYSKTTLGYSRNNGVSIKSSPFIVC